MILVFDLDDTLYDEITYVKSSLLEVAKYLSQKLNVQSNIIYSDLYKVLELNGRGNVFDITLKNYGIYSKAEVNKCLSVYRKNNPEIELFEQAISCLKRFENFRKYIVTDGNKIVQKKKIEALKLNKFFIKSIPSHNFGISHAKPSTYIFNKILNWENSKPDQLVYIGDNPKKDFINLKKEGFNTIRVLTGFYKDLKLEDEFEANYIINNLNEFDFELINKIKKENENRKF